MSKLYDVICKVVLPVLILFILFSQPYAVISVTIESKDNILLDDIMTVKSDLSDLIDFIDYMFRNGTPPVNCL